MNAFAFSLIICVGLICATYLFVNGQACGGIAILLIIGTSSFRSRTDDKDTKNDNQSNPAAG